MYKIALDSKYLCVTLLTSKTEGCKMKYMGSKARHAKEMLPIILKDRKEGQWYVEPFVGGCNMIYNVEGNRLGADVHEYLITMWQAVSVGWLPPSRFTEDEYKQV